MTNIDAIKQLESIIEYFEDRIEKEKDPAFDKDTAKKDVEAMRAAIKALEQEPKTGHWEWVQYDSNPSTGNWHCSECNRIVCGAIKAANPVYAYKYCPNCGAKMQEVEDA